MKTFSGVLARGGLSAAVILLVGFGGPKAALGQDSLVDAVRNQDPDRVATLLERGMDPDSADTYGATALHWAAELGDAETAALLLNAGANAGIENRYGVAPLSLACRHESAVVIRMLLSAGADPNSTTAGGETVLMCAARSGSVAGVQVLLAARADVDVRENTRGQTALMWAAAEGHAGVIQALAAAGADIHARSGFEDALEEDRGGSGNQGARPMPDYFTRTNGGPLNTLMLIDSMTPLMFAVRAGHRDAVAELLAQGADVNETASNGTSVLVLAIINAHYELAEFLLEAGADPNRAGQGWTPLHQVVATPRLSYGRFPHPERTGRMSALELAESLIERGAEIDARMTVPTMGDGYRTRLNRLDATPLLLAAKGAYPEMMRLLLEHGADPHATTAEGTTALMLAAGVAIFNEGDDAGTEAETLESVQLLVEHGVEINEIDSNGETALHGAAYRGHNATAEYLVRQGARLDIENRVGWTPLQIADGVHYANFLKQNRHTAALLRELMREQGMDVPDRIVNDDPRRTGGIEDDGVASPLPVREP